MLAGPGSPGAGGAWSRGDSPLSSQVIRGTGVPSTEHCSTKSWPSETAQSFRTLENEGATSALARPARVKNRWAISNHCWPVVVYWPVTPSFAKTHHCPQHPGLAHGLALPYLSSHWEAGSATGVEPWGLRQSDWQGFFTSTEHPRPGGAQDVGLPPLLWDSGGPDLVWTCCPGASPELLLYPVSWSCSTSYCLLSSSLCPIRPCLVL